MSDGDARERRLLERLRGAINLSRVQAVAGLVAAILSIGGSVWGYLKMTAPPDTGEMVTLVRDARTDRPVADATLEILTPKDALVTTVATPAGEGRRTLKQGTYRLRVSHPRYATETRQIQVLAGQTSELRVRLVPRTAAGASPVDEAARAVNQGVESIKKIFR